MPGQCPQRLCFCINEARYRLPLLLGAESINSLYIDTRLVLLICGSQCVAVREHIRTYWLCWTRWSLFYIITCRQSNDQKYWNQLLLTTFYWMLLSVNLQPFPMSWYSVVIGLPSKYEHPLNAWIQWLNLKKGSCHVYDYICLGFDKPQPSERTHLS